MAGRNITPDLLPPSTTNTTFAITLSPRSRARARAQRLLLSLSRSPLFVADHQRETSPPRRWNELVSVRRAFQARRKHAMHPLGIFLVNRPGHGRSSIVKVSTSVRLFLARAAVTARSSVTDHVASNIARRGETVWPIKRAESERHARGSSPMRERERICLNVYFRVLCKIQKFHFADVRNVTVTCERTVAR